VQGYETHSPFRPCRRCLRQLLHRPQRCRLRWQSFLGASLCCSSMRPLASACSGRMAFESDTAVMGISLSHGGLLHTRPCLGFASPRPVPGSLVVLGSEVFLVLYAPAARNAINLLHCVSIR